MNIKQLEVVVLPDGRVDTRNAATYVGLSEKTMAMWRCQGRGPRFIKRGRVFYYLPDLDAFLKAGEAQSTNQACAWGGGLHSDGRGSR